MNFRHLLTLAAVSVLLACSVTAAEGMEWQSCPANPANWSGVRPSVVALNQDMYLFVDMYFVTHAIYDAAEHSITDSGRTGVSRRCGFSLTAFPQLGVVVSYGGDDEANASACSLPTTGLIFSSIQDGRHGLSPWVPIIGVADGGRVPPCRMFHAAAAYGDYLYVHGGYTPTEDMWSTSFVAMADLWVVDVRASIAASAALWRQLPSSLYPRFRHTLLQVPNYDDRIYSVGGYASPSASNFATVPVELRIESFAPLTGQSGSPHKSPFWTAFLYAQNSLLSGLEQIIGVTSASRRLVIFGSANSSGSASIIDMATYRVMNKTLSVGPLVSGSLTTHHIRDSRGRLEKTVTKIFESMEMSEAPYVLDAPLSTVSCDARSNEIENELGNDCVFCPDGMAADGPTTCTPCSSPFHTLSAAKSLFCPATTNAASETLAYALVTVVVVLILVAIFVLIHFQMFRGRKMKTRLPCGAAAASSVGDTLHFLGFVVDNEVALWQHFPNEMAVLTSALFVEVRGIVERYDVHEVHNTGDHGILVAPIGSQALLLKVAMALQDSVRNHNADFTMSSESVTMRVVLNTGACHWRYNAQDNLVVSGVGAIAVFDLLGRLPAGCIGATEEFVSFSLTAQQLGQFNKQNLETSQVSTAHGLSSPGTTSSSTSFSGSALMQTILQQFSAEKLPDSRRVHGRRLFLLIPKLGEGVRSQNLSSNGLEESSKSLFVEGGGALSLTNKLPSSASSLQAELRSPGGAGSNENNLQDLSSIASPGRILAHPLVKAGLLTQEQATLLLRLTQILLSSLIEAVGRSSEEKSYVFDVVLEALRVNTHRAGGLAPFPTFVPVEGEEMDVLGDPRSLAAAFRLLEVIDMLHAKEIIAALSLSSS
jgi:hypothetical protein